MADNIVKNFKDLNVWKASSRLAVNIYKISSKLPKTEDYGLSSQMQRAAVSIPSNIAEGFRRNGNKEFDHFLSMAAGSAAELETQMYICSEIYDIDLAELIQEVITIQKMLFSLKKSLK